LPLTHSLEEIRRVQAISPAAPLRLASGILMVDQVRFCLVDFALAES